MCHGAKGVREISRKSSKVTTRAMELIHIDTDGPWTILSLSTKSARRSIKGSVINAIPGKSIYYVVFIDDSTGYAWTYFLTTKDTYHDAPKEFLI
jgi:hypothetical protein